MRKIGSLALLFALCAVPLACGDDDDDVGPTGGKGGASGGKGGATSGGASSGGTTARGGATSGGSTARGGATSGGATSGGATAKGGATSGGRTGGGGTPPGGAGAGGEPGGAGGDGGTAGGGEGGASGETWGGAGAGGGGGDTSAATPCEQACTAAAAKLCSNQSACPASVCSLTAGLPENCVPAGNAMLECLGRSGPEAFVCNEENAPAIAETACPDEFGAFLACVSAPPN